MYRDNHEVTPMSNIRQLIALETELRTLKAENNQKESYYKGLEHFSSKQTELINELVKENKSLKEGKN